MPIRERRRLNRSAKAGRGCGQGRRQNKAFSQWQVANQTQTEVKKPFMKIAISTTENSTDAIMDERFGRAPGFIVLDSSTAEHEFIDNQQNVDARQSAGIQSAQGLVNKGVDAVISGHCGPKAFRVLNDAGVKVFMSAPVKVSEAVSKLQAGQLEQQLS